MIIATTSIINVAIDNSEYRVVYHDELSLTWLKDDVPAQFNVTRITDRLDSIMLANQGTQAQRQTFTDTVKVQRLEIIGDRTAHSFSLSLSFFLLYLADLVCGI